MADIIDARDCRIVALQIFGPQSGGKPTVLDNGMGRRDLGDWQAKFRKYEGAIVPSRYPSDCHGYRRAFIC